MLILTFVSNNIAWFRYCDVFYRMMLC